jgi:peptidoglycan-associated lipoprotein
MMKRVMMGRTATLVICVAIVFFAEGCSKRTVSSSGDEFAAAEGKAKPGAVETIKPDRLVTVPDESRPPIEASRSQSDLASTLSPSSPSPSSPSFSSPSGSDAGTSSVAPFSAPAPLAESGGLADVFFDFDQFTLRGDARASLEANAKWLKNSTVKSVLIEGHCDERGTEAYNLVLGEKRAKSAKRYLEDLGVPGARLKTVSFGKTRPFCKERDENCYQLNRRAHFVVK